LEGTYAIIIGLGLLVVAIVGFAIYCIFNGGFPEA
jgi:hypothetical protein